MLSYNNHDYVASFKLNLASAPTIIYMKEISKIKIILTTVCVVAILTAAICVFLLIRRAHQYKKEDEIVSSTKATITSYKKDVPSNFPLVSPLYKSDDLIDIKAARESENPDLYGYLRSEDGSLDYPVMLSDDSEKYSHTDFYGNESEYGCLFISNETVYFGTRNLLINGHHMKNGKMFGNLEKYIYKKNYHKENSYVKLITDNEIQIYKVCAAVEYSMNGNSPLTKSTYFSEEEFREFRDAIKNNGRVFTDFTYEDITLSLLTCDYNENNGRLMVIYKLSETLSTEKEEAYD